MNKVAIILIRLYQLTLSPILGNRCRFYPSCSTYSLECFRTFSFLKALWYTLKRILKCNPFHPGGVDYIPESGTTIKRIV